jgi:hypothetical protein
MGFAFQPAIIEIIFSGFRVAIGQSQNIYFSHFESTGENGPRKV